MILCFNANDWLYLFLIIWAHHAWFALKYTWIKKFRLLVVCTIRELIAIFGRDRRDKSFAVFPAELVKTVSRCSDRHAFVKLLHLLFSKMHKDSSRAGKIISRRCSANEPALRRPISRELIRSRKSFEIPGMHRSALRLLGMCAKELSSLNIYHNWRVCYQIYARYIENWKIFINTIIL